jgi:organic hydroperoxide reductase OsmC/OhrA
MMMNHRQHDAVLRFPPFGSSAEMPLVPTQILVIGVGGCHTALMMMKHCQHRHATEVKQHAASANRCPIWRTG